MKTNAFRLALLCLNLFSFHAAAMTYYVDINSTNATPPYTSWSTAATNIQAAIAETTNGDSVLVNPGVYGSGGYTAPDGTRTAVVATNAVTIHGINGQAQTSINGSNIVRCLYLANGATVTGFTLTGGTAGNGGGVYCASTEATVANCALNNNTATSGAGAYSGTLNNCTLNGNGASSSGGGACNSSLDNCTLSGNSSGNPGGGACNCNATNCSFSNNSANEGGGASGGTLVNCTFSSNQANDTGNGYAAYAGDGGGVFFATVYNSTLSQNLAEEGGGAFECTLINCLLTGNTASDPYGAGGGANEGTLINCTVANNNADYYEIVNNSLVKYPAPGGGAYGATLDNCIAYYNYGSPSDDDSCTVNYSCTPDASGTGDITSAPAFVNSGGGNYQLQSGSPCIDAGSNSYVTTITDLSGGPRIIGTNVDMGAYEYQWPHFLVIETQPSSQTFVAGQTASFSVNAVSPDPLNYQWLFDGTNIAGANGANLTISDVQSNNGGVYSVMVSNALVSVMSSNVTLTVVYPVQIVTQPINETILSGSNASFTVTTSGTASNYQWFFNGTPLTDNGNTNGSKTSTLTIANTQTNNDGSFSVTITNAFFSTLSSNAILTVYNPAQILGQPASVGVPPGNNAMFTVAAAGTAIGYQWFFDGTPLTDGGQIKGSATPTLTILNVQSPNLGSYTVAVTNLLSAVDSQPALLGSTFIRYVNVGNATPVPPYTTWDTAATNIQDAVNISTNGDTILVTNGIYETAGYIAPDGSTNAIVLTNAITLESINGAAQTTINGNHAMRCAYLTTNDILSGFTLTNGFSMSGGGVYCPSTNALVSNCLLISNTASVLGGGAFGMILNNCTLSGNSGYYGGAYGSFLNSSVLTNNSGIGAGLCTLTNCLVVDNTGYVGGVYDSTLVNCTIADNTGSTYGGVEQCALNNCICYFNTPQNYIYSGINYCCTTPLPGGSGNITNAPLFVNVTSDFHLQSNSPCINSGSNAYITATNDLDGNPRVVENVGDMGAYEYQSIIPLTPTIQVNYTNIATGFPLQLQGFVQGGSATAISWNFGDGAVSTNQLLVSHAWNSPAAYNVTLTVSNSFTPDGATATVTIFVVAPQVYVNLENPSPAPPYVSWNTAATNIQNAIDASYPGCSILVSDGVYQVGGELAADSTTNRIVITKPLTVESVNGPQVTVIQGYQGPTGTNGPSAIRGAYVTNGAALFGFTIQGGGTANGNYGGGIYCPSTTCVISNCVIVGNSANGYAGGIYQGTLYNCQIINNNGLNSPYNYGYGGGADGSVLIDCVVMNNSISGYQASGGGVANSTLTNCVVADNTIPGLGFGGGAYGSTMVNCDITGNAAYEGGGTYGGTLVNCINYFNQAYSGNTNYYLGSLSNCCTIPLPSGHGNITNAPILASLSQISANSPCRGAGNAAVTSAADINGNPWANPPSIGCDEPYPDSMFGNVNVNISVPYTNYAPGYAAPFQVNIAGPIYNSVWNFGDGTASVTNMPFISHSWTTPSTYAVTLTAYNDSYPTGITATLIMSITVPTNFYVNVNNPNPVAPYSHWATAATNIQSAINFALPGSLILVSNGVYNSGIETNADGGKSRVAVTQPLTLQSVNGPTSTIINGGNAYRCVYLTNGAVLNGFTVANGNAANGAGVYATSTNATITNCIITSCSANSEGGGTYSGTFYNCSLLGNSGGDGGGALGGNFANCTIANNSAGEGGGVYSAPGFPVTVENCIIVSNSASAYGGGVFNVPVAYPGPFFNCLSNCFITNSVLSYNSAQNSGNAAVAAYLDNCVINSNKNSYVAVAAGYLVGCTLIGNQGAAAEPGGSDLFNGASEVLSNCTLIANGGGAYGCSLYSCTLQNNGVGAEYSTLANCIIVSNTAPQNGAGAYNCALTGCTLAFNQAINGHYGGGAYYSTLTNCNLSSNQASDGGGADNCTLINCTLVGNAVGRSGGGGGAAASILSQCLIMQNIATNEGGGVMSCSLNNCLIVSNIACLYPNGPAYGGGAYLSTLTNCVLADNVGTNGGGAYLSELVNCTVTANSAVLGGGAFNCTNYNSILYYNNGGDYYPATAQYPLNYCCVSTPVSYGIRNITTAPLFVNLASGDFHLQSSSPCINSGNNAYITSATDLDGNPRIQGGTVDIGAYEYQTPTSVISYAYLQQYGLPTDGSVDFKNLNGTAFNVYQDWVAGLNPTNSASVLAMLTPVTTNTATGVTVTWQSVSGIPYFLQRSTNLVSLAPFTMIQNNIIGQTNTTSYIDTSATNNVTYFYRVGVVAP